MSRAYGAADLDRASPNTSQTVFEIASVSKQFTAAAILSLVEAGKLSLTDDVRKYLPELPEYGEPITIDSILTHTSGLRDWITLTAFTPHPWGTAYFDNQDVLEIAKRQTRLNYRPGDEFAYSNTGYDLLAVVIERVTGKSLAKYSDDKFFRPLGMRSTRWRANYRAVVRGRAVAYRRTANGFEQDMPLNSAYGSGGLLTTTGDLLTWNRAMASGKLGRYVTGKLTEPVRLRNGEARGYGRGLWVGQYNGVPEISHAGSTLGYRAWLGYYPTQKLSVALTCNAGDVYSIGIAHDVVDLFLEAERPKLEPATGLDNRAGIYVNQRNGLTLTLSSVSGRLVVPGGLPLQKLPSGNLRYATNEIMFEDGPSFVLRNLANDTFQYKLAKPPLLNKDDLASFSGKYASAEIDSEYEAKIEGGKLVLGLSDRARGSIALEPIGRDAFTAEGDGFRFQRGADGVVTGLMVSASGVRELLFQRVP